ncbi:MAG: zinc-binding dehydrogenase [Candidatus Aenigmarchaeota archaeon]|nr:zinc-binding dehydrogenase [Candidatus Aenigmarchaeota archaeon]
MKAIVIEKHGGSDVLEVKDVKEPELPSGNVLVRVKACALNHLDVFVRNGIPGVTLPHILGSDVSGIIEKVGKNVKNAKAGEKVVVNPGVSCRSCAQCKNNDEPLCKEYKILGENINGGYAELISVPAENVVKAPSGLSFEELASLPLALITSIRLLRRAGLRKGQTILVIGAGGGVSIMAIQVAKAIGAKVIVFSTNDEKLKAAKGLGTDDVTSDEEYDKVMKGIGGVDAVFDSVGEKTFMRSLKSLRKNGVLVTCGATSGPKAEIDIRHIFWKQLTVIGSTMGGRNDLKEGLKFVEAGKVRPVIAKTFPMERAGEAHDLMESGKFFGKIVLKIS